MATPLQSRFKNVLLGLLVSAASLACSPPIDPCRVEACLESDARGDEPSRHLTLGSWNLQWFGSPIEGPSDDALQLTSVRDLIRESDVDIWVLVEIADASQFQRLLSELPPYAGVLAGASSAGQNLALLHKPSVARVSFAQSILGAHDYEFAGRPPLEVGLELLDDSAEELIVIALHAKAFDDLSSWQRRQGASIALKRYLDETHATAQLAVLGDFNDDVDTSIAAGQPSPYANFVADRQGYAFPTAALSAGGKSSTLYGADMIDHHLVSNELMAKYVDGSAEVLHVEDFISSPASAASDHHPVVSRYEY